MKTILIVDDDSDEYLIYSEAMELLGLPLTFDFLSEPLEAVQFLSKQMTDFVFIDLVMPKINGLELIEKIKELPNIEKAKLVILSTYVDEKLIEKASAVGVTTCLQKKVTILDMANMLRTFFSDYAL